MEADVAIQLIEPDRPDVKVAKLGRLHFLPFASRRYTDIYGLPASFEDLKRHRFIDQRGPQVDEDAAPRFLNTTSIEGILALRTNSSTAHAHAIELGIGIGALPTYAGAVESDLIPVDVGVRHHVDIWMTYHPDARTVRRVSIFIDWLRTLFDPKRYPWFGDEFIHPRELLQHYRAVQKGMPSFTLPSAMRPHKPGFGS
jgi:DNA-binding transcriptional LysR family regulator